MTSKKKTPASGKSRKRSPGGRSRSGSGGSKKPVNVRSRTSSRASGASRPPSSRPTTRRPRRFRRPPPTFESRLSIATEILTWLAAIAFGLTITAGFAWLRAQADVRGYLTSPPTTEQSTVWSAPMLVRVGMPASAEDLAADLLAAGFERVDNLQDAPEATGRGVGLFSLADGAFEIWTATGEPLPGVRVDEGQIRVVVRNGAVAEVSRSGGVRLPPTVLGLIGDADAVRAPVALTDVSRWVEPALLSMEDARFRSHGGIDPIGILRALFSNATTEDRQGGSTLTMQLAKNLFLSRDRTIRRKIREVFFASALETQMSKDELLELYLGEVYLGQMAGLPLHGFEQAALAWFGKGASRLELHEAALIVGVIPSPNTYSPVRHPEAALERRNLVLERMHTLGEIDAQQLDRASAQPLRLEGLSPSRVRLAPYAVDAAIERVEGELGQGILSQGVHVHTTIEPLWQRAAESATRRGMAQLDADYPKAAGAQVALVAVRVADGAVVAMVGGRSYADSAYNRATDANRQVGSTIKPLTLVKALYDRTVTPATRLADEPIHLDYGDEKWSPKNYDGKYEGEVSLRRAIEASRNIPAVHLARSVGMVRLSRFYTAAGLSHATALPSAALGSFPASPVEMAGAYTIFDRGVAHQPEVVDFVTALDGDLLLTVSPIAHELVDGRAAAQAMDLLRGVLISGTGARARSLGVVGNAGGKTGTTDEYRDAWFVGLTPELSVSVWVGQDRGVLGLAGSRAALPTWAYFMAESGTLNTPIRIPEGLERVRVCVESGGRAREACPEVISELFVVGTAPEDKCDVHGAGSDGVRRFFGNLFKRRNRRDPDAIPDVIGTEPLQGADGGPPEPEPESARERRRNRRGRD